MTAFQELVVSSVQLVLKGPFHLEFVMKVSRYMFKIIMDEYSTFRSWKLKLVPGFSSKSRI